MLARLWLVVSVSVLAMLPAVNAQAKGEALQSALEWMAAQQQPDGGYSNGFTSDSDLSTTADVVLAASVAGRREVLDRSPGADPLAFLEARVRAGTLAGAGQAAKVALAVFSSGLDPHDFGDHDLMDVILQDYDPAVGLFGSGAFDSALAILALSALDVPLPAGAVEGLLAARLDDGAFSFSGDRTPGTGDSNTTALAVQALIAAGHPDWIAPSLDYFRAVQNDDGGWTYQKPSAFGEETDANSTALVIQALLAAGEDLAAWGDPLQALLALQQPSGAFAFNASTPGDSMLATVQAIPALARVHFAEIVPNPSVRSASSPLLWGVPLLLLAAILAVAAWMGRTARRPEA